MKKFLNNRIIQHTAFWCFYICIFAFNYHKSNPVSTDFLIALFTLPTHLFFTYTQLYLLIPRFLLKKKIGYYLFFSFILLKTGVIITCFSYSVFGGPLQLTYMRQFSFRKALLVTDLTTVRTVFAYLMICGIAVSIKLLKAWYSENERRKEIEKEKTAIELEMLKGQIHPHFLFNTLNNLYSLTLSHSDKAPVVVTHLSDLLRYMLYECNEKEIALGREIEILKEYVELGKLRYGDRIDVGFTVNGNISEYTIAPLLLLPFAENCFKHGINDEIGQCWINIYLTIEHNRMSFIMSNSCSGIKQKNEAGGIGLQNTRKRLELLYPSKYKLQATTADGTFTTKLTIELARPAAFSTARDEKPNIHLQPAYQ